MQRPLIAMAAMAILAMMATPSEAARAKHSKRTIQSSQVEYGLMDDDRRRDGQQVAYAVQPTKKVERRTTRRKQQDPKPQAATAMASAEASYNSLVAEARRYIGSGPQFGRRSLWCGNFMDYVLRQTGHKGGGNLASGYAHYGRRVSGPQVGAIAVMSRKGGGHVGVVSGIDAKGNVIVVSGNHNNRVAESVYPRGRIYAYVMPN